MYLNKLASLVYYNIKKRGHKKMLKDVQKNKVSSMDWCIQDLKERKTNNQELENALADKVGFVIGVILNMHQNLEIDYESIEPFLVLNDFAIPLLYQLYDAINEPIELKIKARKNGGDE